MLLFALSMALFESSMLFLRDRGLVFESSRQGVQEQRARSAQTPQDQHRVCLDYHLFTRVHRGVVVQTGVDRNLPLLAPSVGWQLERHRFVVSVEEEVETVVDDLLAARVRRDSVAA